LRLSIVLFVCVTSFGCGPKLPDDLGSLAEMMNSTREVAAVAASNKVSKQFGKDGLIVVINTGQPNARAMAARWLGAFAGDDVEDVLAGALAPGETPTIRLNALMALGRSGTHRSLPIVRRFTADADPSVAKLAAETAGQIEGRVK